MSDEIRVTMEGAEYLVEKLKVGPGDVVVFSTDVHLMPGVIDGIRRQIKKVFPDNQVLIVDAGARLRKEAAG